MKAFFVFNFTICFTLIISGCQNTQKNVVAEAEVRANTKLLFPEGSRYKELEINGSKVIEVELPKGYFFRVDGKIEGNLKTFTCECSQNGNCYPVLSVGPKKQPSCLSEGCSNCLIKIYDRRENKIVEANWEVEIGNPDFVNTVSQIIRQNAFEGKKIKPIVSFTKLQNMYAATETDFMDEQVQDEIKELVQMFYKDIRTNRFIPFPKIDYQSGKIPEGYRIIPLEVSGKYFLMVAPIDNGLITLEYRTLPYYDFSIIKCYGSCSGSTCKATSAPGSDGTILIICSGCANACYISY